MDKKTSTMLNQQPMTLMSEPLSEPVRDSFLETPSHKHPDAIDRLETFLYLTPVIGVLPSMWAIYRHQRDRRQLAVCRLSIVLASAWLSAYLSLTVGADLSGASTVGLRLLFLNSMATSGYFIVSLWLMMLLWQKKSIRLPGFSALAERKL